MEDSSYDVGKSKGGFSIAWGIAIFIFVVIIVIMIIGGIMMATRSSKLGDSCNNTSDCADNLVCQNRSNPNSTSNKKCLAQSGVKCTSNGNCVSGLNCFNLVCVAS